jgi:hypothetical protein
MRSHGNYRPVATVKFVDGGQGHDVVLRFHRFQAATLHVLRGTRVSRENAFGYLPHLRKLGEEKNIDAIFLQHRTLKLETSSQ